ncbi:MAG: toprim domain-containing protein [Candidatus Micrarchaeota archaeon]|nr:toprim domain-containing protein [Candidatus Micrarchaeota archaeon]
MKKFSPMAVRKLQKKRKLLDRVMKELKESGAPLLVEGKRDREALERIGVKNRIFLVNMSPDKLCLRVSKVADEAVILTDFDEAGQKLCRRIEEALHSYNVLPNTEVRRKLRYLLGVYNFEDIDRRMEEFKKKIEGDMDG